MPNVQEVLRQNEFNNLVSTEIIDAYINRLTGKRAVDINTIEELDSLNFFPMSYIASLNDDNKEKLLNVFKEAASSKDYRKFIQVVEARVPGINNRTNNGFAREYENFANLAGKSQINSVSFRDLMDSLNSGNSIFVRLRDRLRGIQNFRSMAGNRSDGFSGSQVARILSGLYYVNDEFVSKADDFVRFMEVRGLFTNRNEVTRHYNIEVMNNMGIYTNDIQNLIDSEEYREVAYNQNTNFNDYNIDDIKKISELDEKISSLVATPYIRNMLNLPEGQMVSRVDEDGIRRSEYVNHFKNLNNLNRTELVTLEELLKRNDNDNLQTITARLREYSSLINGVVDKFYNEYSADISRDINGNPVITRDNIKYRLVSALSREGAFAKSNVEDFIQVATNVCLKNDWIVSSNLDETSKNNIMTKKGNINGRGTTFTSCYVMVDNKVYELDNIEFARDKDNKLIFQNNLQFEEIKRKLTKLYGISFENVKKEDFTLGYNPLAENFLDALILRQTQENQSTSGTQESNASVENSKAKEDRKKENVATQNVSFAGAVGGNVFVGSDIYMKALIEARKRVREYILSGQVEIIDKNSQKNQTAEEKVEEKVEEKIEKNEKKSDEKRERAFVNSSKSEATFESEPEIIKLMNDDIVIKDNEHTIRIRSNKKDDEEKKIDETEDKKIKSGDIEEEATSYENDQLDKEQKEVLSDVRQKPLSEMADNKDKKLIKSEVEASEKNKDIKDELFDKVRFKSDFVDPFEKDHTKKVDIVSYDPDFARKQEIYNKNTNPILEEKVEKSEKKSDEKREHAFVNSSKSGASFEGEPVLKETEKRVKPQKVGLYYFDELGRQIPTALKDGGFVVDKKREYWTGNNRHFSVSPKKEREFDKILKNAQTNKNIVREYFDNQNKESKTVNEENELVR